MIEEFKSDQMSEIFDLWLVRNLFLVRVVDRTRRDSVRVGVGLSFSGVRGGFSGEILLGEFYGQG